MAAPTAGTRQPPVGIHLDDGFSTLISFAADEDVSFWEITVQPPGMDGDEPINTTTMHNVTWRTFSARQLKTLTTSSGSAAYDPSVYEQLVALVNVETTITIHFPDGSTLAFYGALTNFEFEELSEGGFPVGTYTITPTNVDPATGDEEDPVIVSVPGT